MKRNEEPAHASVGLVDRVVRQVAGWADAVVTLDVEKWRRVHLYQDVLRHDAVHAAGVSPTGAYGITWDLHFNLSWPHAAGASGIGADGRASSELDEGIPAQPAVGWTRRPPVAAGAAS